MKKVLSLVAITMFMVCCDIGPRQTSASSLVAQHNVPDSGDVLFDVSHDGGMEFHIYHNYNGVFVVNQTKELLEVELLKKQIDEISKRDKE